MSCAAAVQHVLYTKFIRYPKIESGKIGIRSELFRVFSIAWKFELTQTILVNMKLDMAEIYTYFPFANGQCGRNYEPSNVAMIGIFDFAKIGKSG